MDPRKSFWPHRFEYQDHWSYRAGLVVLSLAFVLLVLAPSLAAAVAGARDGGPDAAALARAAAAMLATAFLIAAVVRDFRGRQRFNRGALFPLALLFTGASLALPLLLG